MKRLELWLLKGTFITKWVLGKININIRYKWWEKKKLMNFGRDQQRWEKGAVTAHMENYGDCTLQGERKSSPANEIN